MILFSGGLPEGTRLLDRAIEECWARGTLVVCPTGNVGSGHVMAPAHHPLAVAAGAVDRSGSEPSFSGSWTNAERVVPDVLAPGVDVTGPIPGGGWATQTGTSAAAAQVAGVAALLLELRPGASVAELRAALTNSASRWPGIIDVPAALEAISRSTARTHRPAEPAPARAIEARLRSQLERDHASRRRTAAVVFHRSAPNRGMSALETVVEANDPPSIEVRHLANIDTFLVTEPAEMIRTLCGHEDVQVAGAPDVHWPVRTRRARSFGQRERHCIASQDLIVSATVAHDDGRIEIECPTRTG